MSLSNTKLYSSGTLVSSGLALAAKTLKNGQPNLLEVSSGGTAIKSVLSSGGVMKVFNGGYASRAEIASAGSLLVSSGAHIKEVTVKQGGCLEVGNGASATYTTIDYAGELQVYSGGNVNSNIINSYGAILLHEGANAVSTTINANGGLHVYSGAAASNTIVNRYGFFGVGNGATVYNTSIGYGGETIIWGGGKAVDNDISVYGAIILSSGAVAENSVVNSLGGLHVYSGATAYNTTVKQGGFFGVGLGASTTNTIIDYAGELKVWSGGYVESNYIDTYGAIILLDGAVANYTTIDAGGGLHIYSGATAFSTEIQENASLGIGLGGQLYTATQAYNSELTFYDGAILRGYNDFAGTVKVSGTVDAANAQIELDMSDRSTNDGAIIDNISGLQGCSYTVSCDAAQQQGTYYLAGGASNFNQTITITQSGTSVTANIGENVYIGKNKYQLVVNNDQLLLNVERTDSAVVSLLKDWQLVDSAASYSGITIGTGRAYDHCEVNMGTLTNATVETGRTIDVTNSGKVDTISVTDGASLILKRYATGNNISINRGYLYVEDNATCNTITIDSDGVTVIKDKGTANGLTVLDGTIQVTSRGIANNVSLQKGKLFVERYGSLQNLNVQAGGLAVINDKGYIDGGTISSGALLHVSSGGTLTNLNILKGGLVEIDRGTNVTNLNFETGAAGITAEIDASTTMNITSAGKNFGFVNGKASGMSWTGNVRNVSAGYDLYLQLYSGAEISDSVLSAGHILAYSGAVVKNLDMHYYAQLNVYSNAAASGTVLDSEAEIYAHGGSIYDTSINSGGYVWISSEGSAYNTHVYSSGHFDIGSDGGCGGVASNTTVHNGGYFQVISGTSAYETTVHKNGYMIADTGNVYDTHLSGGAIIVKYCGVASNTTIDSQGTMLLYRAGSACNTTLVNGTIDVTGAINTDELNLEKDREKFTVSATLYTGSAVLSNTLMSSGYIKINSGGIAYDTEIDNGTFHIVSGGYAYDVTMDDGNISIESGGTIESLKASDGYVEVHANATLKNLTADDEATVILHSNAKLTGNCEFDGSIVTSGNVDVSNAYIVFDLGDRTANDQQILDDINNVSTAKQLSIEVDDDQTAGTYNIAGGAGDFSGKLTLYLDDGDKCGNLAIGDSLKYEGKNYSLVNNAGMIALKIS